MQYTNIIVIPVYKPHITHDELCSLMQCIKMLNRHDIALVCPQTMDTSEYIAVFKQFNMPVIISRFDDSWFLGLDAYSGLCLSDTFYKRFSEYEYMLIYQLDCWVFDDKLQYWCNMGYDYVGAPWSQKHLKQWGITKYPVGNGGLSLRKIDTMIKLTSYPIRNKSVPISISFNKFFNNYKQKHKLSTCIINFPIIYIKYLLYRNSNYTKNEDIVIAYYARKYIRNFSVPNPINAAQFAIETDPQYFYKKIGHLPFGTHAWNKPEHIKFWTQFIKI